MLVSVCVFFSFICLTCVCGKCAAARAALGDFCYECLRQLDAQDRERHKSCGAKCGVMFCDFVCYREFLTNHSREHLDCCKIATSIERQQTVILSSRKKTTHKVTRGQQREIGVPFNAAVARLNRGSVESPQDRLLLRLACCEALAMLGDDKALVVALCNAATDFRLLTIVERSLQFGKRALALAERLQGVDR